MKRVALLVVFLVAACASLGSQAHTLSLAYKAGDTYKYRFHATSKQTASMSGMSIPITFDMTANETLTVKSVDSSGVADLTISLGDLTVKTVTGGVTNTTTGIPSNSTDVKVRSDGTIVSVDGHDVTGGNPLAALSGLGGGFFVTAVLPDHSVKAGDTWSKTYDQSFPNSEGKFHIVSDSKYVRDESVNGVNAAVVETKSTGSIDMSEGQPSGGMMTGFSVKGTFTTDVTTWIDPNGHRVVKSHSAGHDDVTINFPTMSSPSENGPIMQGPVTATGDSTTDLNPA
ncbi:MAG TPA: hypothetical protein VJR46_07775 [Candidatus Dormibacteraeota bacterium]|nr:hypothetical protein [Candidatus Dormibacteraeota bacterium]